MKDLIEGVIRTPLSPKTTFLDDPLRILRAIRFASRFNFSMHPTLHHAILDAQVKVFPAISVGSADVLQSALKEKVSKERVGKEVKGMFTGNVLQAFKLIYELKLFDIVFALPPGISTFLLLSPVHLIAAVEQQDYQYKCLALFGQMYR